MSCCCCCHLICTSYKRGKKKASIYNNCCDIRVNLSIAKPRIVMQSANKGAFFSPLFSSSHRSSSSLCRPPLVAKHRLLHLKKASFSLRHSSLEIQFSQRFPEIRSPDRFFVGDSILRERSFVHFCPRDSSLVIR